MAINSKKKGNKAERELANWFKAWSGLEFSRVPQSGGLRWKKTDNISGDIIMTDERGSRRFPFSIESKSHNDIRFEHYILNNKKNKVKEFWDQCKSDAERANKFPILFMRYSGMSASTWFVMLPMDLVMFMDISEFKHPTILIKEGGNEIALLHSNDISSINYKEFILKVKKRRNAIQRGK